MACRDWLLLVGSCCLILAVQVNAETTSPTTTNETTSQGAPQETAETGDTLSTNQTQEAASSSTSSTTTPPPSIKTTLNASVTAAAAAVTTSTATSAASPPTTPPASSPTASQTATTPTASTTSTTTPSPTASTTPAPATPSQNPTMMTSPTSGANNSSNDTDSTEVTPQTSTPQSSVTVSEATTPSSTVAPVSQGSTRAQSTSTPSTTTVSHAASTVLPKTPNLLINEFSYNDLFSNGSSFYIEIKRVEDEAVPKMVVVVLDLKMICIAVVQMDSAAWKNNLTYKTATLTPANRRSVIVSLYTAVNWTSCSDFIADADPVDATIVSQDPVTTRIPSNIFVPDYLSRILIAAVNKSSTGQTNVSVVRCDDAHLDPGSFIIAASTFNQSNKCDLDPAATPKTITLNYTACNTWNDTATRKLINYFVEKVGEKFQCGFSPVYVQNPTINCTKSITMQWYIPGKFETQYDNVVNDTTCMDNITPGELCIVSACRKCIIAKKISPKKGDISVTVGVVIACIVIFLVIVAIVILYIRKKRRGILQFRMTRLDDDDDDLIMSNDTDDFVGGQEASFSNSSYTRFK